MQKILLMVLLILAASRNVSCQALGASSSTPPPGVEEARRPNIGAIARLTTLIDCKFADGTSDSGTGFYFNVYADEANPVRTPHWVEVKKTFVVTTRHLLRPRDGRILEAFTFNMRGTVEGKTEWLPVVINVTDLKKRLHFADDANTDVAAIDVGDLITAKTMAAMKDGSGPQVELWTSVSNLNFPGPSNQLEISSGDDVIVVGYPKLFYDTFNKLPVFKLGLLVTPWGMKYENKRTFLIDYRGLFGGSGSPVITKPTQFIFTSKGQLMTSTDKNFLFLGMFVGEPFLPGKMKDTEDAYVQEKIRVDLGEVVYYDAIQQTIDTRIREK